MKRTFFLYAFILIVFGFGIFFTMEWGQRLLPSPVLQRKAQKIPAPDQEVSAPAANSIWSGFNANLQEPLSRLFIQLIVIVIATRVVGSLFKRIGQPSVVGEMFAGILLGPSLFGLISPEGFHAIFPVSSLGTLKLLSQIGVCLFMFVVGMELDVNHLRHRAHTAVVVSHASIVIPYFLGVATALVLFSRLSGTGSTFVSFALFMGISMSITAFPVLARILQERHMESSALGSAAIACAAIDDVTAWTILAFVIAIVRSTGMTSIAFNIGLVIVFVALMLLAIRPRLPRWFGIGTGNSGIPSKELMAGVLVFTFLSALTTEVIGIHSLFGAFLAGVVMPQNEGFRNSLKIRIENFSSIFLLPLFFAFTGLRTQVGLINDTENWLFCLLIVFVATFGKLGGSMLAARFTGMSWLDSFSLGALMNTRGLMELIAINIGYDLGILSPEIFAMLVIMALTTTFMTGPLLSLSEALKRSLAGTVTSHSTL